MTPSSPVLRERGGPRLEHLRALGLFAVLTVLATWPLAAHLFSRVPGDPRDPGDYWAYYWDLWWVKHALLELRQSPLHTSLLYHPDGTSLYFHSLLLAPSALMAPITAAFGTTVSYNALVWLSFVGSAFGVYLLVLFLLDGEPSRRAAFLAGTAYALSAPRFSRMMGHLDLLSTQWLPFALLYALRTARDGGWGNALALTTLTVLTALTNWYLGASLVLALIVLVCERLLSAGFGEAVRAGRRIAPPLLAAALLTSPAWGGMLGQAGAGGRLPDSLGDSIANSADVIGFVLPSSAHPIWGPAVAVVRHRLFGPGENVVENTVFLGFVPLVLAVLGWREARSRDPICTWPDTPCASQAIPCPCRTSPSTTCPTGSSPTGPRDSSSWPVWARRRWPASGRGAFSPRRVNTRPRSSPCSSWPRSSRRRPCPTLSPPCIIPRATTTCPPPPARCSRSRSPIGRPSSRSACSTRRATGGPSSAGTCRAACRLIRSMPCPVSGS